MKKKAPGPWLRRNQLPSRAPSSRVPPYKPPRKEFKVTEKEKEKTSAEVIDVQDSEERQDANKDDEESQTETQFGLVWERYDGPPAETTDTSKDKQSRDVEEEKIKDTTIKAKKAKLKITHVIIPETEEQGSDLDGDDIPFSELKEKNKTDRTQQPIESNQMEVEK